jgi:hypothetical protein
MPPREGKTRPRISGEQLKIGRGAWGNRLLLYIEHVAVGPTHRRLAVTDLQVLVTHLDAVEALFRALTRQLGKGVHDDVCEAEVRLAYAMAWYLIARIAR